MTHTDVDRGKDREKETKRKDREQGKIDRMGGERRCGKVRTKLQSP